MGDRTNRDLTGLHVEHLTFDHNAANNAIVSQAEIAANPQFTVAVFVGTDISFHDLQILNASSINNLVVSGSTCARVRIRRCRGSNLGDDPATGRHASPPRG